MSRRTAVIVMIASIVLLVVAAVIWRVQSTGDRRADLVGVVESTTTTTSTVPPDTTTTTTTIAPPPPELPELPVGLTIPALGVESAVVPVGLEPDGEMEVPPASEAGWYLYGPRPGSPAGTAVIAAHVDYGGERGVFFDLRSLQVGAEISVTDAAGAVRRFVVTERYQVDKDELPIDQIFVADGPPGLTLITCGGSFDGGARSYRDNIVVRAEPSDD